MGVLIEPDLNTNYLINEDEAIETVEKKNITKCK